MFRFRSHWRSLTMLAAALLVVGGLLGHGQAQSAQTGSRGLVQTNVLPGIDRGLDLTSLSRSFGGAASAARNLVVRDAAIERVGTTGAHYQRGRVIVKFRSGVAPSVRLAALAQVSPRAAMLPRPAHANFDLVTIGSDEDAEDVARAFGQRPDVEYAQAAYRVYPYFVPDDPLYEQLQWNFKQIDLERGWDIQLGATSSIVVAVVDTGMAYRDMTFRFPQVPAFTLNGLIYPALGTIDVPFARATDLALPGAAGDSRFVAPFDFIWNDAMPVDLYGHGTHVSGTIGQLTNNGVDVAGIAFNVRLMPVKVVATEWDAILGAQNIGSDDIVAQGIRYAVDSGANVINMSIGRQGPPAPVIEDAIRYAVCTGTPSTECSGKGVFIAIAGGNGFQTGNQLEVIAEIASRVSGAVSVAALDRSQGRAYYSTTGSWIELSAPGGSDEVDTASSPGLVFQQTYDFNVVENMDDLPPTPARFLAPHFDVFAVQRFWQGTSMATPHVTGLAALLMQQGIKDPAAIEAALELLATPCSEAQNTCSASIPANRNNSFGFGEISARNTLRGLGLAR